MKHNQNGSVHIIIIGILVVLLSGTLTYTFLKKLDKAKATTPTSGVTSRPEETVEKQTLAYVEFEDWRVRFPSDTTYTLKRNSAAGNGAAYFISVQELAETCSSPSTPWLGIIQRFDDPEEKQTIGPEAGKTMDQIFGGIGGITIDGNLYYFNIAPQWCTRNTSNPEIEQAAKKLESEIKSLESY